LPTTSSRRTLAQAPLPLSRSLANLEWALLVGGLAVLFFLLPHGLAGDDLTRFDDIERLIHDGDLSDSRFSLVMPVVSAPFLLLGEAVASPEWWAARFNVIVVAVGLLVGFRVVRTRIDEGLVRQFALVLLFASLLTNRLRDYNAEVLTATLVAIGIVVITGRRHVVAGWIAIVVGVVNTPAAIVGLGFVAVAEALRERRLRPLLWTAAAAGAIMLEAWIRRGGPLTTGYAGDHGIKTVLPYSGRPGFSYPALFGLLSILFSFGRGLVFFTPGLLLWFGGRTRRLVRPERDLVVLMLVFVAGLIVAYAKWWAWYGGLSWGPRFFVFAAVPASALLAVRLRQPGESGTAILVVLGVLTLSAWVSLSGVVTDLSELGFCAQNDYALESLCWYTPEYSPLWRPLVDFPELSAATGVVAAYCVLVYAYLAVPLCVALFDALRSLRPRGWRAAGWRI
jgi:hypothetical protein